MIEFRNVTKKYDNKTVALNDVNIRIEKGEFVFVVGSSGAGKSTFLKLMMREEVPSSGSIIVDGTNLNKIRKKKIPYFRRKLGIVFQDFRLIPNMTVFDNVAFALRVVGVNEKKIRRRVPYLLSLMGLSEKSRNYPKELSGGEQQRVALARALANDADIIIADEPTGNVDPQMSYEIVDLLMRLNEAGKTIIMVTHEHSLVKCFDKRVVILEKGSVVSDGMLADFDQASAHINPASEISSRYDSAPAAEDYSVYSAANSMQNAPSAPSPDYSIPAYPETAINAHDEPQLINFDIPGDSFNTVAAPVAPQQQAPVFVPGPDAPNDALYFEPASNLFTDVSSAPIVDFEDISSGGDFVG